jgi:hypothetical protein
MAFPQKGRADFFKGGDFNAYCSECGRKRKASDLVRNWQGMYRCPEHNEPRQPQDFVRSVPEQIGTPWAQILANADFTLFCSMNGCSAIPDWAMPDCSLPDSTNVDPTLPF